MANIEHIKPKIDIKKQSVFMSTRIKNHTHNTNNNK